MEPLYQKNAAILTNTDTQFEHCRKDCNAMVLGDSGRQRHEGMALRGKSKYSTHGYALSKLHSIPPSLCRLICDYVKDGENRGSLRAIELSGSRSIEEGAEERGPPLHDCAN